PGETGPQLRRIAAQAQESGLFHLMQLGFLHFEVSDLAAWEAFATGVLGLDLVARRADGGFTLGMDGHRQRFFVSPGPADDLAAVGFESDALDDLVAGARGAGIVVAEAPPQERDAARRFTLVDPAGIPVELVAGLARVPRGAARFVADELGLGHVVLSTHDRAASERFYTHVLGFR